jgi:CDP-paratose synthetase
MKILITGGTGFVGKTLVPYLYQNGYTEIVLLVRNREKANSMFTNLPIKIIDTHDNWRQDVIGYNADVVLHLATLFSGRCDATSAKSIVDTNILFTTQLLEAVMHTDCSYFVNIGTFTEFLNGAGEYMPNNLYSASKTAVRPILKFYQTQSKWKWVNIIVYSPYGRYNSQKKVIDYMLDAMDTPTPVAFSKGEQVLDFVHVDDMADFFVSLLNNLHIIKDKFEEFHLGTGVGHSIREVAAVMEKVFGKKIKADWGGLPYRTLDVMHAVAPISKNISMLGWRSQLSLEEGMKILKKDININLQMGGVNLTY